MPPYASNQWDDPSLSIATGSPWPITSMTTETPPGIVTDTQPLVTPVTTLHNTDTQPLFTSVIQLLTTSLRAVSSSTTLPSAAPSTFTNATTLPSPSLYSTSSGLSTGAKSAIGTVVPAIAMASLSLVTIYLWHKRKRSQLAKTKDRTLNGSDSTQPYLQQKAELDSEESRGLELDAQELRYELDGANGRYEIGGSDGSHELPAGSRRQGLRSLGQTQELRGKEHPKELEGQQVL